MTSENPSARFSNFNVAVLSINFESWPAGTNRTRCTGFIIAAIHVHLVEIGLDVAVASTRLHRERCLGRHHDLHIALAVRNPSVAHRQVHGAYCDSTVAV